MNYKGTIYRFDKKRAGCGKENKKPQPAQFEGDVHETKTGIAEHEEYRTVMNISSIYSSK